jgi:4-amino-4-deoxy-L-arabinose transferase-like glycosyltransferase
MLAVAGLGLLLVARALLALASSPGSLSLDETNCVAMAERMLDTGVYSFKDAGPDAFVTPGYPVFLAALLWLGRALRLADQLAVVRLVQAVLSVAALVPLHAATRALGGRRAAGFAVAMAVVYPSWYMAQNRVLTEALFAFLFVTWLWLWTRVRERGSLHLHAAAAAVFALAILVRPAILPILAIVYAIEFAERADRRRVVLGALAAALTFAALMSPWWIRNRVVLGETVLFATQSGNPLLRGTDPWDPYDNVGPTVIEDVPEELHTQVAVERIREGLRTEPLNWIAWFTVGKFWWLWGKPWMETWWLSQVLHYVTVLVLGWAGVIFGLAHRKLRWLAISMIAVTLLHQLFIPIPRYMFPLTPAMFLLGGVLLDRIAEGWGRKGRGREVRTATSG